MTWFSMTWGRCGFGRDAGPPPALRLGLLRLSWWRGGMAELVEKLRASLSGARRELGQ